MLAKARDADASTERNIVAQYPQACVDLLPEEILQYLYAYVTSFPLHVDDCTDRWACSCCCGVDACVTEKTGGFFL